MRGPKNPHKNLEHKRKMTKKLVFVRYIPSNRRTNFYVVTKFILPSIKRRALTDNEEMPYISTTLASSNEKRQLQGQHTHASNLQGKPTLYLTSKYALTTSD